MAMPEASASWTFTSSGVGAAFDCRGYAESHTFYIEAGTGSSGTVQIESARTSTGTWVAMGPAISVSTAASVLQLGGPLMWVRPHATACPSTATLIVDLIGN